MSAVEFVPPPPVEELPLPPEPERRRSFRLGKRSLTARLVLGVVALVAMLVLAVTGGTYFALRAFLAERLDQQLQATAQGQLSTLIANVDYPSLPSAQPVWFVALEQRNGAVINAFKDTRNLRLLELRSGTRQKLAAADPNTTTTVQTADGLEMRVTTRSATFNPSYAEPEPAVIVVGLSTDEERRTLRQVILFELILGAAALVVALAFTYAGVRFSLRGLRRVTLTAREVAAELGPSGVALQRRVPVTEEGTEVAQLTDSMNTLLEATETQFAARVESEERMRQFLADASHELRTPLTSIRGYAELARMQRAIGQPAEDNIGRIEAEGTRMSRLVEDLLVLARGDASGSTPQRVPIDIDELVADAVSSSRAAFPDRPIAIDATASYAVIGDPDQLLRVVRNLIANAVTHTPPGPPIRVRAFTDGGTDGVAPGVVVQVVDAGPGLAPEDAAHVFERFWRADKARTRARGGSGLGLSIVATIVQAHGGSVRFDSTVEHGSTVTVWLPAAG